MIKNEAQSKLTNVVQYMHEKHFRIDDWMSFGFVPKETCYSNFVRMFVFLK